MGSKTAPVVEQAKREKPVFVRNPYLDEEGTGGGSNKTNRDALTLAIPTQQGIGFEGRGGAGNGTRGTSDGSIGTTPARSSASLATVAYSGPAPIQAPRTLGAAERPSRGKGWVRHQDQNTGKWGDLSVGTKKFIPDAP